MSNTNVVGLPPEGPYKKLKIRVGSHVMVYIKRSDGKIILISAVNYNGRSQVPKEIKNKTLKQAIQVFKSSEEKAKK